MNHRPTAETFGVRPVDLDCDCPLCEQRRDREAHAYEVGDPGDEDDVQ